MSVTNMLVFWWEHPPKDAVVAIESVFDIFGAEKAFYCCEQRLPLTPIRFVDGQCVVDEEYDERTLQTGVGYINHGRALRAQVVELARHVPMLDIDIIAGARGQLLYEEQKRLPAERFNGVTCSSPTLCLGPRDIWEWSMEAGNPPPVLYYGRAAVSLSLSGYGSPDMHPPEFCELLVNLPEMKKLRLELDAIFGESRAVYMVNS
jgi:hypothetical protein